ncbi:hypothetical protein [Candidatus Sororendozoicomonas aggregata]|uniref:hypothetical protein n=1 Tax=Candidatus Sororendozoicomonas aggregata TaxID=3073239 RepID=UPI002ED52524
MIKTQSVAQSPKKKEATPEPPATDARASQKIKRNLRFRGVPANSPGSRVDRLRQHRWTKLARKHLLYRQVGRWFLGMVVAPWLVCAVYFMFIASDRYVSEASFMVEKNDGSSSVSGLSLLGVMPQIDNDQRIVEAFVQSPDMLSYLDSKLNVREHYSNGPDWLSRLSPGASYEDFLAYYRDHIEILFNQENGLLTLEVQGFEPEYTRQLTQLILERSEAFVNEISHKLANEQQGFVQKEVSLAEQRLRDTTTKLLAFQSANGLLSATEQGAALSGIMNELQAELVQRQTELQTQSSYLNEDAAQIVTLKQRIAALKNQIEREKARLTGKDGTAINDLVATQQSLQLDLDLATQMYSATLAALETARTEASRKIKQLVVVSSPQLAEDAKYPSVVYTLTNILLVLLMVFALVRMMRATVREHRD